MGISTCVYSYFFPSLSNFYCVLRCACGRRPGNEVRCCVQLQVLCWDLATTSGVVLGPGNVSLFSYWGYNHNLFI